MTVGSGRVGRAPGPPGLALLELEQLGPIRRAELRLVPRQQARELGLKLCDPISHRVPRRYRSR